MVNQAIESVETLAATHFGQERSLVVFDWEA